MPDEPHVAGLPMSTALEIPGLRIRESLGVCYGLVVRSMGFVGGVGASFKALRRGHAHAERPGADWRPTNERFRDPRTQRVMRVWEDAAGARHYVPDDPSSP